MRALYLTLCIVAVTALPPRQYKRVTERKLELTTEAKIEPKPVEETKDPADKKDITDKEAPRAYYENQSTNVVSTTSTTITDQEKLMPEVSYAPQVVIGKPQVNPLQNEKQYIPSKLQNKKKDDDDKKNVYTVNVYVNFPNEDDDYEQDYHHHHGHEDEECRNGKCWAKSKCKEGQVSVKGVCTDRP